MVYGRDLDHGDNWDFGVFGGGDERLLSLWSSRLPCPSTNWETHPKHDLAFEQRWPFHEGYVRFQPIAGKGEC